MQAIRSTTEAGRVWAAARHAFTRVERCNSPSGVSEGFCSSADFEGSSTVVTAVAPSPALAIVNKNRDSVVRQALLAAEPRALRGAADVWRKEIEALRRREGRTWRAALQTEDRDRLTAMVVKMLWMTVREVPPMSSVRCLCGWGV